MQYRANQHLCQFSIIKLYFLAADRMIQFIHKAVVIHTDKREERI